MFSVKERVYLEFAVVISLPRSEPLSPWQQEVRDTAEYLRDLTAEVRVHPVCSLVILEVNFGGLKTYHKYWCPQPVVNARASRSTFKYSS